MISFTNEYLIESMTILSALSRYDVENLVHILSEIKKDNGRLFILGVGGSAGTASHAVNDFRKICGIET